MNKTNQNKHLIRFQNVNNSNKILLQKLQNIENIAALIFQTFTTYEISYLGACSAFQYILFNKIFVPVHEFKSENKTELKNLLLCYLTLCIIEFYELV